MKPGDWVIVDLSSTVEYQNPLNDEMYEGCFQFEEYDTILPPRFGGKETVEGRIVSNPNNNSQDGPRVEFPWIAEKMWKSCRIPWEMMEPSTCDEHGKKLYHDYEEEWYCPFCTGEYKAT